MILITCAYEVKYSCHRFLVNFAWSAKPTLWYISASRLDFWSFAPCRRMSWILKRPIGHWVCMLGDPSQDQSTNHAFSTEIPIWFFRMKFHRDSHHVDGKWRYYDWDFAFPGGFFSRFFSRFFHWNIFKVNKITWNSYHLLALILLGMAHLPEVPLSWNSTYNKFRANKDASKHGYRILRVEPLHTEMNGWRDVQMIPDVFDPQSWPQNTQLAPAEACWGEKPKLHTTFNARTYLQQPQLEIQALQDLGKWW